ncbi:hypothetical protein CR513_05646, partial [Mucuna pruriens]
MKERGRENKNMHSISILIMNHFKHGGKYSSLYMEIATCPNWDPQYPISATLGQSAQRPMTKSLRKEPATLLALTQYYDPPLRCFTFQGFQLAPTLEEYERLLKVFESKVLKLKKNRNKVEAIPKAALEERLQRLQEEEDWLAFVDVYRLLVYGIMIFPQIERYVDLAAIDAFLNKRDQGEHLVVVVLANTYYTLDYYSKKNAKGLRCCTSLLFLWLTVHLFHSSKRTSCPIEDYDWSCIKPLTKAEWTAHLDEATERSICWYP